MKIVQLTTDNREPFREYFKTTPYFGTAPEALLQGLARLPEVEVHVVSCTQQPMHAPEKLSDNTWFHLLHVPKSGWLRTGYQGCVRAIRRKVRELQPDIVHGQGTERECALGAVFSGFPNVVTIHGNMELIANLFHARVGSYLWCASLLERLALSKTLGVFCNSAYTESAVAKRARRTFRVANAVRRDFFELPAAMSPPGAKPRILNVGLISPRKRQLEILKLAEELHRAGRRFELQFVGTHIPSEAYATEFLGRVKVAESHGFARYLGPLATRNLISALDDAAGLIHAPSEEAFGLVVAEALVRNLHFFGTDVGGIPDIAKGIEGTELFSLQDERSLMDAVARWLQNGCSRPQSAAGEMRARYHPDVIAQRHIEIYRELGVR